MQSAYWGDSHYMNADQGVRGKTLEILISAFGCVHCNLCPGGWGWWTWLVVKLTQRDEQVSGKESKVRKLSSIHTMKWARLLLPASDWRRHCQVAVTLRLPTTDVCREGLQESQGWAQDMFLNGHVICYNCLIGWQTQQGGLECMLIKGIFTTKLNFMLPHEQSDIVQNTVESINLPSKKCSVRNKNHSCYQLCGKDDELSKNPCFPIGSSVYQPNKMQRLQ